MSELRKKTVSGLFWTFSQQFSIQLINFAVSIILARLLLPAEFGLLGMIAIFIAIGNSLVDGGMTSSLIRTQNPDQLDYSVVFFTNLSMSIVIYIVSFFTAPYISLFFEEPILTNLVRVYCLTFIIRAFSTVQATKLNKEMNFKLQMIINVPSLIIGGISGAAFAYYGYGVWSLVYMNILQSLVATIQLWIYSKWKPVFTFDINRLKMHLGFGYKLTLSGLINTIVKNVYNLIIGKFFTASQLGFFIRAKSMQELPVSNISSALNKVTYPLFSSIMNEDIKLKSVYKRLVQQVFFWITPILVIAIVLAEPLFRFLLTEKWLPAVPYFQILCISGILTPLNTYNLNILLVKGKSGQYLKLEIVKNVFTILGALLVFPYGMYGLLWSIVISVVITFFINAYYCGKVLNVSVKEQIIHVLPIILISLIGGVICYGFDILILKYFNIDIVRLIVCTSLTLGFYLIACYVLKIEALKEFIIIVKNRK